MAELQAIFHKFSSAGGTTMSFLSDFLSIFADPSTADAETLQKKRNLMSAAETLGRVRVFFAFCFLIQFNSMYLNSHLCLENSHHLSRHFSNVAK